MPSVFYSIHYVWKARWDAWDLLVVSLIQESLRSHLDCDEIFIAKWIFVML
jgi:hypothetical protein